MTSGWRKALRDAWLERARSVLVVLAVALGVAGFSAMLDSFAILTRALDEGYRESNPASATLVTDRVDAEMLAAVRSDPAVADAQAKREVSAKIEVEPLEWRKILFVAAEDLADVRIAKIEPERGAWPPAAGQVLLERDALQVARADVGDALRIRTARGVERELELAGVVHDVGRAQARMEDVVYAYVTLETLELLGEEAYLDRLQFVAREADDREQVRALAAAIGERLAGLGHAVREIDVPEPGQHPHAALMGTLMLAMAVFGLLIVGLSCVIVANLVTALMAAQVRQIGVMKSLGGSQAQIASIYLAQALVLGVASTAIGLALGRFGAHRLCEAMSVFLNFDVDSFAVPGWIDGLTIAVGLAAPVLAAALPVRRACRVPVLDALRDLGTSSPRPESDRLDRLLARSSFLGRPLSLAVRNGFRNRRRVAWTVGTLATGGLFFMVALDVRESMIRTLDRTFETRKYELVVAFAPMIALERVERAAGGVAGVERVEGWITADGSIPGARSSTTASAAPHPGHLPAIARAIHGSGAAPDARFSVVALPLPTALLAPDLASGRWLEPGDTDAIVVNTNFAFQHPEAKLGAEIPIVIGPSSKTWRVVGLAREAMMPPTVYLPRAYFDELGGHAGMTNSARFALAGAGSDSARLARVREALDRGFEREELRPVGSSTVGEGRYSFDQHMRMIYVFLVVTSAVLAFVGGVGLATTISLNVLERRRELGVLRALGATPTVVRGLVVAEACSIALAAWALSLLAAWPVSGVVGHIVSAAVFRGSLDRSFAWGGPLVWLGLSLAVGIAASLLPARHASLRPVREWLVAE